MAYQENPAINPWLEPGESQIGGFSGTLLPRATLTQTKDAVATKGYTLVPLAIERGSLRDNILKDANIPDTGTVDVFIILNGETPISAAVVNGNPQTPVIIL